MRTTLWASMVALVLASGAGCKKKDDSTKAMDKAASSAAKAQEDVNEQSKDVHNQQKDVIKDQQNLSKDQADVAKQQGELSTAETELAQARERYSVAARQRLANLDTKIHELEASTSPAAKDAAAKLRVRRDELAVRLEAIGSQTQAGWDTFKKDVDTSFDKLEKDVNDATKK